MPIDPTNPARRRAWLGTAGALAAAAFAPPFLRHARAGDAARFDLGVASGHPRPDSVVLWTRLTGPALPPDVEVRWELAHDEAFTRPAAGGIERATADDAHSVHAEATGLEPAREYWYRFTALGQRSAPGRTRTAPAAGQDVARLDFAIASCQRWDHGHWAAWRDLVSRPLDLVLFLGDYIYETATPVRATPVRRHEGGVATTLEQYRARYAQYKSDPLLQAAHAAAPWIVIWDDHEVANDYAGDQGERLEPDFPARRAAAYQAWWEHMPLPRRLRPVQGRTTIHGRLDWGRLARLQWVDDRQYRDPQACPPAGRGGSHVIHARDCASLADAQRSMLGAAQERWLAEGWSRDHPWNLLAQQTLMARCTREPAGRAGDGVERDPGPRLWTDGWDGYPAARTRLLSAVAERRVPGTVVLGGDVHAHYVADLRVDFDDERGPIIATEFCSTSISSHGPPPQRLETLRALNPHLRHARSDQRGGVRFVLTRDRLEADLRAVADASDAASAVGSQARFVVEAGRPGAVPA